jgi:hypothetical protein
MNVQHAPTVMAESRERHSSARVPGRWLLLARGTWIALVVLTLATFFASLPVYLALLQTPCAGSVCEYQQLTPGQVETLTDMGLSPGDYTAYTVALTLAIMVVCLAVSTLLVWRRSNDRMALFVALMLVTLGPIIETTAVPESPSAWQVPNECLTFLALAMLLLVFLLFPTGQFVPSFTRWIFVVFLVLQVPLTFWQVPPLLPNTPLSRPGWLVSLGEMATLALVQLYRYRRVSSSRERQQTKWVVFGLAVPITVAVSMSVPYLMFPVFASPGSLYPLAYNQVSILLSFCIPLSFGFAILRYRLWDIDVLISRTLVYGTLTLILTGVYVGLVIGLQALLGGLISQDNGVAIVLSTLAIYWLFQPLRRRIQRSIDRRFYRSKYDATKTLAAFSAALRNEMDLSHLSEQLVAVVEETMQPAFISLWLCQSHPIASRGEPTNTELDPLQATKALTGATNTIEPSGLVKEEPHG